MDSFQGNLGDVLIASLPVFVLLLVCGAYFLLRQRNRRDLVDSPWFWGFAFGAVGLLGVWAISGKYDDRQKRVEARYEARERIAAGRAANNKAADSREQGDAESAMQSGYGTERKVPLHFLAGGLLTLSAICIVMLWRGKRTTFSSENDR